MYIAMYCLGAVAAAICVVIRYPKYSTASVFRALLLEAIGLPCIFMCAKLLFGFESWLFGSEVSFSGIRIYGAIYAIPLFCFLLKRVPKLKWTDTLDLVTPSVALATAIGRIGCQFAGCCGGEPLLINGRLIDLPEQLIEGSADIIIFGILLKLEQNSKQQLLYPVFLMLYGTVRFLLEFFRDSQSVFGWLTFAQLFSIVSMVLALLWILMLEMRKFNFVKREEHNK